MCLIKHLSVVIILIILSANYAVADVRLYSGTLEVVLSSGKSCETFRGRHQVYLILSADEDNNSVSGYFGGKNITTGSFVGPSMNNLDVSYPFYDRQRAEGNKLLLRFTGENKIYGELRDRHLDSGVDDCNFDFGRLEIQVIDDVARTSIEYQRLHALYDAQLARSTAIALMRQGQFSAALAQNEKAVELVESVRGESQVNTDPYIVSLANAYIRLGRYDEMNRLYIQRYAELQDDASRTILNSHRVKALVNIGHAAMLREEYNSALESLRLAYSLNNSSKDAIAAIMSVYVRSGRHDEAITFLTETEKKLEQESDKHDVQDAIALVYFKKAQKDDKAGKQAEAEASLKKAIQLDPHTAYYVITLARWRHKAGNFTEADEMLKRGLDRFRDEASKREIYEARSKMRQTEEILKKMRRQDG